MSNKFYFDLSKTDCNDFNIMLEDFKFLEGVRYNVGVFIVPSDGDKEIFWNRNRFGFLRGLGVVLGSFVLIKVVPFTLTSSDDKENKLSDLFSDIFISASYLSVGSYSGGEGMFEEAVCISISRHIDKSFIM